MSTPREMESVKLVETRAGTFRRRPITPLSRRLVLRCNIEGNEEKSSSVGGAPKIASTKPRSHEATKPQKGNVLRVFVALCETFSLAFGLRSDGPLRLRHGIGWRKG